MSDNEWELPASPPPPLFTNQPERNFQKQVSDELTERIIGQSVLYYPIDLNLTQFDELYGEAINKSYLDPIHIYVLIEWKGIKTTTTKFGVDKVSELTVHFSKRRLTEDQDVFVQVGDFILYNDQYYEIRNLDEPKQLWGGHEGFKVEISANCRKARKGTFHGN